ncbi:MAG TPA: class I SAM-dependent methyltransferase [Acidimicrobiales bacterium]|nr:class I SAM-dependent methyltransferase [Acidimicrobiales bacterium]
MPSERPYYRANLALVHHLGFGFHADLCAPGLLALLEPMRERGGVVLELGCGSGALTRYLLDAGHQVIATDASPGMLDLARDYAGEADIRQLTLPDDPLPEADAVVSIGHVINYLPDRESIDRALGAAARAVRPGGLLAIDLQDHEWVRARPDPAPVIRIEDDWVLVTRYVLPAPDRFDRDMTTFVRAKGDCWHRDDEYHGNIVIDTAAVPALLRAEGVEATVQPAFGDEKLPAGLVAVVGHRS